MRITSTIRFNLGGACLSGVFIIETPELDVLRDSLFAGSILAAFGGGFGFSRCGFGVLSLASGWFLWFERVCLSDKLCFLFLCFGDSWHSELACKAFSLRPLAI